MKNTGDRLRYFRPCEKIYQGQLIQNENEPKLNKNFFARYLDMELEYTKIQKYSNLYKVHLE